MIIYALTDPRHSDEVRYVGKTKGELGKRVAGHVRGARRGEQHPAARWLRKLDALGLRPGAFVLEADPADWQEAERRWIAHYRTAGRLLNISDGGEGGGTYVRTPEMRAAMSERHRAWYAKLQASWES